jgi:hypothetical protein
LVCGGRWWNDQSRVDAVLDRLHSQYRFTVLIQGGQVTRRRHYTYCQLTKIEFIGADYQAKVWAEKRDVPVIEEKADWASSPRGAGFIRNSKMLRDHKPDLGVAFTGQIGTADMIRKMRKAGVPVLEFDHAD